MGDNKPEYDKEEVSKHNTSKDLWIVIGGNVLDVTKFLDDVSGDLFFSVRFLYPLPEKYKIYLIT